MCGIIGYIGFKDNKKTQETAKNFLIQQYQRQFERGTKGFGIITINKNKFNILRATEPTKALLDLHFSKNPIILFHHRMPTSTDNTLEQTHPIFISHKKLTFDWLIMHNGIIYNDKERKKIHEEEKYKYTTETQKYYSEIIKEPITEFNDSETFAIDLARYLENLDKELQCQGSFGFIALKIEKKSQKPFSIIWGKDKTNPLSHEITKKGILIASELPLPKIQNPELTTFEIEIKNLEKFNINKLKTTKIIIPEKIPEKTTIGFTSNNATNYSFYPNNYYEPREKENNQNQEKKKPPETLIESMERKETSFNIMTEKKTNQITELIWEFYDVLEDEKTTEFEIGTYIEEINKILGQSVTAATYLHEHYNEIEKNIIEKKSSKKTLEDWTWPELKNNPKTNEQQNPISN